MDHRHILRQSLDVRRSLSSRLFCSHPSTPVVIHKRPLIGSGGVVGKQLKTWLEKWCYKHLPLTLEPSSRCRRRLAERSIAGEPPAQWWDPPCVAGDQRRPFSREGSPANQGPYGSGLAFSWIFLACRSAFRCSMPSYASSNALLLRFVAPYAAPRQRFRLGFPSHCGFSLTRCRVNKLRILVDTRDLRQQCHFSKEMS